MTPHAVPSSRTIVIAPDSFKSSLAASVVAIEIAAGWREVFPQDDLLLLPQADGGEGTLDAMASAIPTAVRRDAGMVSGPDGRPTAGSWLQLPGGGAVVELAQCCGLPLMLRPDAAGATTRGLGEVIARALDHGATSLVIALGGSASTDGGAGALRALGLGLFDADGDSIAEGGAALNELGSVERSRLRAPPPGGVLLLTDVVSPLTGPAGAAAIFGPQKGASVTEIRLLDAGLRRLARVFPGAIDTATPGAGAAGGTAWGFASAWGATIIPGAEYLARLTGLPRAMARADLVITGEGHFDHTSLQGKVVGQVLALAEQLAVPVNLIAGQISLPPASGTRSISLASLAGSVEAAFAEPRRLLRLAARQLAQQQYLS